MPKRLSILTAFLVIVGQVCFAAETEPRKVAVRDIASVEGVRENPLVGYGIVVGLNGTGCSRVQMSCPMIVLLADNDQGTASPRDRAPL